MARIFYHTVTGNIYGVHPGAFSDPLPADIDFIDVAETTDQIAWPINAEGLSGERYARIQGSELVAFNRVDPPEDPTILALRDLADILGPTAVAKIESRFGPSRFVA